MNIPYEVSYHINSDFVRSLCISRNYYTDGDNEDYKNMLEAVDRMDVLSKDKMTEIAKDIYDHSDIDSMIRRYGFENEEEAFLSIVYELYACARVHVTGTARVSD